MVAPQNAGFTPTPPEVDAARETLRFYERLDAAGETEGTLNGRAVDRYEAARAAELLEWAAACARRDAEKAAARERTNRQQA